MSAKILIVDDHDVLRYGVRSVLAARSDWEICGEAATGSQAIAAVAALKPDLVILDITMPGMSGLEAALQIAGIAPQTRILIFTMHESQRIESDVREARAHGFVQKSEAARDLILAVERLLSGKTFFRRELDAELEAKKATAAGSSSGVVLCTAFRFA
jgi:DNA-binding NarL/FixJ family response regulator